MNSVSTNLLACGVGLGTGIGGSLLYKKVTGKAAGVPGSVAHILTNDKLDKKGKVNTFKEQLVDAGKDTLKLGATAAGVGGAAALAYAKSPKAATFLNGIKDNIAKGLSKISFGGKNLKEMIKGTKIFSKVSSLPTPAKVAIAAGAAVIAIAAPIVSMISAQKAGYIEGKNEA